MNVMGLVTAKSFSSRVQRKNFKPLKGVPLYQWTTEFLHSVNTHFSSLVLSSDKPSDFDLPESFLPITRPRVMCEDCTPHLVSVLHAVDQVKKLHGIDTDWVILFQPTNPIRQLQELTNMISLIANWGKTEVPVIGKCYYRDENVNPNYIRDAYFPTGTEDVLIRSGTMYAYNIPFLHSEGGKCKEFWVKVPKWRGYNMNNEEDFFITEALMNCHNYQWEYVL
jgi:hypothetical protein